MTYIIGKNCIGTIDASCAEVCPVECIYSKPGDNRLYINPEECIDCAACEPVCPVNAIYPEDQVPEEEQKFTKETYEYDFTKAEPGNNTTSS